MPDSNSSRKAILLRFLPKPLWFNFREAAGNLTLSPHPRMGTWVLGLGPTRLRGHPFVMRGLWVSGWLFLEADSEAVFSARVYQGMPLRSTAVQRRIEKQVGQREKLNSNTDHDSLGQPLGCSGEGVWPWGGRSLQLRQSSEGPTVPADSTSGTWGNNPLLKRFWRHFTVSTTVRLHCGHIHPPSLPSFFPYFHASNKYLLNTCHLPGIAW